MAKDKHNEIHVPINRKSKDGKVRVWIPEDKDNPEKGGKYKRVYAVDARELIAYSGASWLSPEDRKARGEGSEKAEENSEKAIEKTTAKELQAIIDENDLDVNLKDHNSIGDKREAVKNALVAKERAEADNE